MAEVVPEKSRGLKFAEQQLLRHGWEHGKGLGRAENGISEAIKVKVKCDKGGVGHKEGDQFTFQWWDHVFNKASSALQVESDRGGIKLTKTVEEDEDDGMVSNKRPRKAALARDKLYGCFVKSATLLSGQEKPEQKSSSSDSSSSDEEEEDRKLDLSSTTNLSDADLMRACGGRTAHKGARHGMNMSAKLARLEQQEAEFMAKYGKKTQPESVKPTTQLVDLCSEMQDETVEDSPKKKKKKKKSDVRDDELNGHKVSENREADVKPKRKKKKKKADKDTEVITQAVSIDTDVICIEDSDTERPPKTKRKHKSKRKNAEEQTASCPAVESHGPEETEEPHADAKPQKKKKKSSKKHAEDETSIQTESNPLEPGQDCVPKSKKKKSAVEPEEADATIVNDKKEQAPPPKKKKKTKCTE